MQHFPKYPRSFFPPNQYFEKNTFKKQDDFCVRKLFVTIRFYDLPKLDLHTQQEFRRTARVL